MFNATIIGNLGKDPKLSYADINGESRAVANFSLAVNNGDKTTWVDVAVWGKQAETAARYLTKGRKVAIETNDIRASVWVDSDGTPRPQLKVNTRRIHFCDSNPNVDVDDAPELDEEGLPA